MRARKLLIILALLLCAANRGETQTLDEVYKRALTEGGTLNFYATLAQVNAASILPAFEKRFPGIKSIMSTPPRISSRQGSSLNRAAAKLSPIFFRRCWTA